MDSSLPGSNHCPATLVVSVLGQSSLTLTKYTTGCHFCICDHVSQSIINCDYVPCMHLWAHLGVGGGGGGGKAIRLCCTTCWTSQNNIKNNIRSEKPMIRRPALIKNTKRFKRMLIYFDTDTQSANMNLSVFGSCFRLLAVILFQIIFFFFFFFLHWSVWTESDQALPTLTSTFLSSLWALWHWNKVSHQHWY